MFTLRITFHEDEFGDALTFTDVEDFTVETRTNEDGDKVTMIRLIVLGIDTAFAIDEVLGFTYSYLDDARLTEDE